MSSAQLPALPVLALFSPGQSYHLAVCSTACAPTSTASQWPPCTRAAACGLRRRPPHLEAGRAALHVLVHRGAQRQRGQVVVVGEDGELRLGLGEVVEAAVHAVANGAPPGVVVHLQHQERGGGGGGAVLLGVQAMRGSVPSGRHARTHASASVQCARMRVHACTCATQPRPATVPSAPGRRPAAPASAAASARAARSRGGAQRCRAHPAARSLQAARQRGVRAVPGC